MIATSYNSKTGIQLSIANEIIVISNLPIDSSFDELMLFVTDGNGYEYNKQCVKRQEKLYFDLSQLKADMYYFQLYRKSLIENQYWSYLDQQNIPIHIHDNRTIKFKASPVLNHNANIVRNFRTDNFFILESLKSTDEYQSNHSHIKKIVDSISRNCNSEYDKIRVIHDWIAENIYYDMDAFHDKSYLNMGTTALDTLMSRRSVCQGYSDLSVAMLRTAGIPATGLMCYALGISTDEKWTTHLLSSTETNHKITMAFTQNRWIIMDITWDSDNEYKNGIFGKKTGLGFTYKYFDVTIPFLSFSHRLKFP